MLSLNPSCQSRFVSTSALDASSYRPAVGILLLNSHGDVWVAQRHDNPDPAWQMPQGGIDEGEDFYQAALRELFEETSVQNVTFVATMACWYAYDLPPGLANHLWNKGYKGQRQRWFAVRFLGDESEIDINTASPEFRAWRWANPTELPSLAVAFKRNLYQQLILDFASCFKAA